MEGVIVGADSIYILDLEIWVSFLGWQYYQNTSSVYKTTYIAFPKISPTPKFQFVFWQNVKLEAWFWFTDASSFVSFLETSLNNALPAHSQPPFIPRTGTKMLGIWPQTSLQQAKLILSPSVPFSLWRWISCPTSMKKAVKSKINNQNGFAVMKRVLEVYGFCKMSHNDVIFCTGYEHSPKICLPLPNIYKLISTSSEKWKQKGKS